MLEDRRLLATFSVTNLNDAGAGSLRQAVIDANSNGGADDIVFQSGLTGTIALTGGEMSITESVTITGNGATDSVIDAQQASRIFNISGGDVTLNDLTLTNGRMTSGSPPDGGAILFLSAGMLEINGCVLSNNAAREGGAISAIQGEVVVSDSALTGNSALITGGALFTNDPLTIRDSTLSDNSAAVGGAIAADLISIQRSTFDQNTAQINGGAIQAVDILVENSTFSVNTADGDGGAIDVSGPALITQTTFFFNSAERGGAIHAMNGPVDVLQSTLHENIANSSMTVLSGNGIFSDSAPLTIRNSIVASPNSGGRSDVQPSPDPLDPFVVEYSLIGTNIGTTLTPTGATTPDAFGNLVGDFNGILPGVAPLADNGGPTMTGALVPSSPALNRGSNALASVINADQRSAPFARVFGGTVDMGAFELQDVAVVVDTNADEDDGDYSAGDLSLREAVRLTSANPGADTITFAPSTDGTDFDLTLGLMTITETLTITGNGAADTVIDAQHSSEIFSVTSPPMTEPDLTVQGLSLRNGMSTAGLYSAINSLSTGTLTLSDSVVSGNTGGAVGHRGALSVTRSTFAGNSGAYSLGVNSGAAISANGAITVTESTFSENTDGASGGAIGGGSGEITVIQSTLTGNTAWQGGAVYGGSGPITVIQSTITDNTALGFFEVFPAVGGGIYSSSAPVTIQNSVVAGNTDGGTAPDVSPSADAGDAFVVEFSLIGKNTGTGLTATGANTPDANGNLIGDATGIDPLLAPLADNGGPTQTRALLVGSPAYNQGSNAIAAPFLFDQRGAPFPRVLVGTVDMGAFESVAIYTTEVSINSGGDLLIEDIAGGDSNDLLTLSYDPGTMEIVIVDPDNDLGGPVGTQVSNHEIRVPVASIPGDGITVLTYDGTDSLTVDPSMLDSGLAISYVAGNPTTLPGDSLTMDLTGAAAPVVIDPVGGTVVAAGQTFLEFSEVETLNLTDAGRSVAEDELYVRATGNRERIVVSPWNDGGVKLRISDLTTGSSTTFTSHFGLDESGNQALAKLTIFAGAGDDVVSLSASVVDSNGDPIPAEFHGEDGNDYLTGANADDILVGGPGDDRLSGGEGDNQLFGDGNQFDSSGALIELPTDGNDNLVGRNGADALWGGGANDRLSGSGGDDVLNGGTGDDTLDGGQGVDILRGEEGDDVLNGSYGDDILLGGAGDDRLYGRQDNDILIGGSGADELDGDDGNDLLVAGTTDQDDANDAALLALLTAWSTTGANNLTGITGDGNADSLKGDTGADEFWAEILPEPPLDDVQDAAPGESINNEA